jgi:hypothetical protein
MHFSSVWKLSCVLERFKASKCRFLSVRPGDLRHVRCAHSCFACGISVGCVERVEVVNFDSARHPLSNKLGNGARFGFPR